MAEKTNDEKVPSFSETLTCPLCLNIFDGATILTSCGHTFCRKCLKNYDLSHQDLDHMICPLCRKITKLSSNRVDDFPTNVTVNGLVDNYHAECGGMNAVLEMRPKCTACKFHQDAVSFCRTCNNYMCTNCDFGHKHLTSFFEGHEIVPLQDIIDGKVSIGQLSEKCCIHKQEIKDMFCEDCKVHVCLKCVIVGHQNHNIKNQADFEQELRLKPLRREHMGRGSSLQMILVLTSGASQNWLLITLQRQPLRRKHRRRGSSLQMILVLTSGAF